MTKPLCLLFAGEGKQNTVAERAYYSGEEGGVLLTTSTKYIQPFSSFPKASMCVLANILDDTPGSLILVLLDNSGSWFGANMSLI